MQYQMNPVNDFYFRNAQQQMNPQLQLPFPQYQFPPIQQQKGPAINANWVTSMEEAKASQIDFLATNIFLDTGTGNIYLKRIGENGKPQFITYIAEDNSGKDPILEINARLTNIENYLGGMKNESVSGNAGIRKPDGNAPTAVAEQDEPNDEAEPAGISKMAGNDFWKKRK